MASSVKDKTYQSTFSDYLVLLQIYREDENGEEVESIDSYTITARNPEFAVDEAEAMCKSQGFIPGDVLGVVQACTNSDEK